MSQTRQLNPEEVLTTAQSLRWEVGSDFHEIVMETIYTDAARIADRAVTRPGEKPRFDLDHTIDRIVTHRFWGFPFMILLFTLVFWITITGANIPSQRLATLFLDIIYPILKDGAAAIGMPWWLSGLLIDGMYLATAWVISVMLPPMAIFFPLFTLLEDFGFEPGDGQIEIGWPVLDFLRVAAYIASGDNADSLKQPIQTFVITGGCRNDRHTKIAR